MNAKKTPEIANVETQNNNGSWWSKFVSANKENKVLKKAFDAAEKANSKTSDENLAKFRKEIDSIPENLKEEIELFNKKYAVLEKRVERRIADDFGGMLRYYRINKKMSLAELGRLTNISPSYINRIESGARKAPSYPIIEKIAEALDISVFKLLATASEDAPGTDDVKSFAHVIFSNSIFIKDKEKVLSKTEKEKIIELIEYIYSSEWKDKKHVEMMEIAMKIEDFKRNQTYK